MTTTESSTRPDVPTLAERGGIATVLSLVVNIVIVWAVTTTGAVQPFRPLAVSFIPDVTFLPTLPGSATGAIVVLMAMHVTVAVICYAVLTRPLLSAT